ncbi:DUF7560 family zinc ribbon protein [Halodesulfurarchaeum formicicum]
MTGIPGSAADLIYRFTCPVCGSSPLVDGSVREDMLNRGCYLCDSTVSEADFEAVRHD